MAERRGFEPRNQLPSYYLSKVAQSTTLPSLLWMMILHDIYIRYIVTQEENIIHEILANARLV